MSCPLVPTAALDGKAASPALVQEGYSSAAPADGYDSIAPVRGKGLTPSAQLKPQGCKSLNSDRFQEVNPFLLGRNTKFRRFFKSWSHRALGASPDLSGDDGPLFPCAAPYPEVLNASGSAFKRLATRKKMWSKQFLNCLFTWNSYVALGMPDCREGSAFEPNGGCRSWKSARDLADPLLVEVMDFGCHELRSFSLALDGGRADVEQYFSELPDDESSPSPFPCKNQQKDSSSTALPERVAVPLHAGSVDPRDHLSPERAQIVNDLAKLRMPEDSWGPLPIACHRVPFDKENDMALKLLESNMCCLVPESILPRRKDGRLILALA